MTSKELRKLSRKELIELFLTQSREYEQVKEELTRELERTRTELTRELDLTKRELQVTETAVEQLKLQLGIRDKQPEQTEQCEMPEAD